MSSFNSRTEYAKLYDNFRGVDFSSDHTKVADNRFAYLVNMYKDYQSAQGNAIETIPGFRTRVKLTGAIHGIHRFKHRATDGTITESILVHHGTSLSKLVEKTDEKTGEVIDALGSATQISSTMNEHKSTSFVFNNRLHILDGKNFLVYDGTSVKDFADTAYNPTAYINTIISGENANAGTEYEQRNLLSPYFKQTFVADGKAATTEGEGYEGSGKYFLSIPTESVLSVKVYGTEITATDNIGTNNTAQYWVFDKHENSLYFMFNSSVTNDITRPNNIPRAPEKCGYPKGYAGVEITAKAPITKISGVNTSNVTEFKEIICGCTIASVFDNRVFLSGNPKFPNHVFYCGVNGETGYTDTSYWGVLNHFQEGIGNSPVTAMIPLADSLLVLKSDTQQDGSIYYHKRYDTGENLVPVIYPSTPGLNGTGCLGAAVNFLDDPVFISRFGVEGIGQLSVRYERAIEHRSSLIDAVLLNCDLKNACLEEWNGYLILLVDGKIFMADSRQRYAHETGVMQYEWYYLEDIGVYDKDENGEEKFYPATIVREIDGNLFFGTANGHLCSFNFDKRDSTTHEIPTEYYTFNGRGYISGCATKMDCCGIPHLTKSTVNRSTVIKTKKLSRSAAKIAVRTNDNPSKQIARINTGSFNFADFAFDDFTAEQTIFAIREKEKKWVEKQYYIYSDELKSPFALFYISYNYYIAGRIKTQGGEINE